MQVFGCGAIVPLSTRYGRCTGTLHYMQHVVSCQCIAGAMEAYYCILHHQHVHLCMVWEYSVWLEHTNEMLGPAVS